MPKAKPFSENERTAIEAKWEEASTTIDPGNVAEMMQPLAPQPRAQSPGPEVRRGNNKLPARDAPIIEEPSGQSSLTSVRDDARLYITQGSDVGREIGILPGKNYTIGRGLDSDIVLTDIAVSRKHFDLRFEDNAWIIADRGSGNGTSVNGNIEDDPFLLAHGDLIEIGNTIFRFDQPDAVRRPIAPTMDLDNGDDDMATVAGKALAVPLAPRAQPSSRPPASKSSPPPPRPTALSHGPPLAPPRTRPPSPMPPPLSSLGPPSTLPPLPLPNTASRQMPAYGPGSPAILGDPIAGMPHVNPTTLPAPGSPPPPLGSAQPMGAAQAPMNLYPAYPQPEMPSYSGASQRFDISSSRVAPLPFDAGRYGTAPQLSNKLVLAMLGIGGAIVAAVVSLVLLRSKEPPVVKPPLPSPSEPVAREPEPVVPAPPPPAPVPAPVMTPPSEPAVTTPAVAVQPVPAEPPVEEPPKITPVEEPPKVTKTAAPEKPVKGTSKTTPKVSTQVAAATPSSAKRGSADAARNEAERLYKQKKFADASSYLAAQAKKFDDDTQRELRRTSDLYAKLGRAYSNGVAQGTSAIDRYESLRQAQSYDGNVGNAFADDIKTNLETVAPKAALLYISRRNYQSARAAMLVAKQLGATADVKLVATKLESAAGEIYSEAVTMQETNPTGAKEQLKLILQIVEPGTTWYKKAQQRLSAN